jgi:hypothetical protein
MAVAQPHSDLGHSLSLQNIVHKTHVAMVSHGKGRVGTWISCYRVHSHLIEQLMHLGVGWHWHILEVGSLLLTIPSINHYWDPYSMSGTDLALSSRNLKSRRKDSQITMTQLKNAIIEVWWLLLGTGRRGLRCHSCRCWLGTFGTRWTSAGNPGEPRQKVQTRARPWGMTVLQGAVSPVGFRLTGECQTC